jgi:hypothetical protein
LLQMTAQAMGAQASGASCSAATAPRRHPEQHAAQHSTARSMARSWALGAARLQQFPWSQQQPALLRSLVNAKQQHQRRSSSGGVTMQHALCRCAEVYIHTACVR